MSGATVPKPWPPGQATKSIREKARDEALVLLWTEHAKDQMADRDLIMGDVLHVLKNGFVYADAEPSTRPGLFKYAMESKTPNSGNRVVRVIAIPSPQACEVKVVTVMWADEPAQKG
jgi:Domain of unknown function (DUF4258)